MLGGKYKMFGGKYKMPGLFEKHKTVEGWIYIDNVRDGKVRFIKEDIFEGGNLLYVNVEPKKIETAALAIADILGSNSELNVQAFFATSKKASKDEMGGQIVLQFDDELDLEEEAVENLKEQINKALNDFKIEKDSSDSPRFDSQSLRLKRAVEAFHKLDVEELTDEETLIETLSTDLEFDSELVEETIRNAVKNYSLKGGRIGRHFDTARLSLKHHHGVRGTKRAHNFFESQIASETDTNMLLTSIYSYLNNNNNGNTNPSSFRTMLLTDMLDYCCETKKTCSEVSENYQTLLRQLETRFLGLGMSYDDRLNALFNTVAQETRETPTKLCGIFKSPSQKSIINQIHAKILRATSSTSVEVDFDESEIYAMQKGRLGKALKVFVKQGHVYGLKNESLKGCLKALFSHSAHNIKWNPGGF